MTLLSLLRAVSEFNLPYYKSPCRLQFVLQAVRAIKTKFIKSHSAIIERKRKKLLQKSFQRRRRRVISSSSSLSPRDRAQKPTEKLLDKKTQIKYCHRQSNTSTSPFSFLPPLKTPHQIRSSFFAPFAISRVYSFHFILINLQLLIRDFYIRNKNMARR